MAELDERCGDCDERETCSAILDATGLNAEDWDTVRGEFISMMEQWEELELAFNAIMRFVYTTYNSEFGVAFSLMLQQRLERTIAIHIDEEVISQERVNLFKAVTKQIMDASSKEAVKKEAEEE